MVAALVTAVGGESRSQKSRTATLHLAGLALGALVLWLLVGAAGSASSPPVRAATLVLGAIGVLWSASTVLGRPLPLPSRKAQVPLGWQTVMSPSQFSFAYGVGLGLGVFTQIHAISFFICVAAVFIVADPLVAVVAAWLYAVTRALPVFWALAASRGADPDDVDNCVEAIQRRARIAAACETALSLGMGITLLLVAF